jgi:hypothetical protein
MFQAGAERIFFGFEDIAYFHTAPTLKRTLIAELIATLIFEVKHVVLESFGFAVRVGDGRNGG